MISPPVLLNSQIGFCRPVSFQLSLGICWSETETSPITFFIGLSTFMSEYMPPVTVRTGLPSHQYTPKQHRFDEWRSNNEAIYVWCKSCLDFRKLSYRYCRIEESVITSIKVPNTTAPCLAVVPTRQSTFGPIFSINGSAPESVLPPIVYHHSHLSPPNVLRLERFCNHFFVS